MWNFNIHVQQPTAIYFVVALLLLGPLYTVSYQEAEIVRSKICSVADVPNSQFYPEAGVVPTKSFYRILELHNNHGNNSHMYIGAKNALVELLLSDLSLVREISVPKYIVNKGSFNCEVLPESELLCHNYVTFVQEINETTSILCGTNALFPRCVTFARGRDNLDGARYWDATGITASGPKQNTVTYAKLDGEDLVFYSGAPTQIQYSFAFSRTIIGPDDAKSTLTTDTSVSEWIESASTTKDPSFVGQPIEYNGKVYFFFREEAVEARNVAKVVYSRVGQVCANDAGTDATKGIFTTFLKARLSCATDGDFKMSLDYLHGIFRSPDNPNIIFGAFTTPDSAFAASAVCAYDLREIENLFATSAFKGQKTGSSLWLNVPASDVPDDPRPGTCDKVQPRTSYTSIQLMSRLVPNKVDYNDPPRSDPESNPPLILLQQYRFQKLVVQGTALSGLLYDMFFLGTSEGQILKAYIYEGTPRIVDEIILDLDNEEPEAINVLMISENGSTLYASTMSRVYSVPTENCGRFKTCDECVSGMDPACSWQGMECSATQDGIMDLATGNPSICPVASSTPAIQTNPATPASETTDQTPSESGMTTGGSNGQTPKTDTITGTENSSASMGTTSPPPPPQPPSTTTQLIYSTTPLSTTSDYILFNQTQGTPNTGEQLVCMS